MKRSLRVTVALIAVCAGAVGQETNYDISLNPAARFAREGLTETLRRPLFAPSRRPPPPLPVALPREEPPPAPPEPPHLTLMGIVRDKTAARVLVQTGLVHRFHSLRLGDEIEGWRIIEITAKRVTFGRDARLHVIPLFSKPARSVNVVPPQPPSPAEGD